MIFDDIREFLRIGGVLRIELPYPIAVRYWVRNALAERLPLSDEHKEQKV
jgi:hypothetical protein